MPTRNAAALEFGGNRIEGQGTHRRGRREHLASKRQVMQAAMPDTVMARAFLRALRRWLLNKRRSYTSQKIAIPTGVVSDAELARVLRALFGGGRP